MAEDFNKKVGLIEIEVDNQAAVKQVEKLSTAIISQNEAIKTNNDEIKDLNKANKDLESQVKKGTISTEKASTQIEQNKKKSTELKKENLLLKDGLKNLNGERSTAVKATKLQANSLDALRQKVLKQKKELNGLNTETKLGKKRFDELSKSLKENNDKITQLDQSAGDFKTTVGRYKEEMGDAASATDGLTGGMGSSAKGFLGMARSARVFLATPIGAILGLLAFAIMAVKTAFTSSEEGQNKYNKLMGVIGVTIGNISDLISDFGLMLINVFRHPIDSIETFAKAIRDNIINRFEGMLELVPQLGKAITQLFSGDFSGAAETAVNAVAKVTLGVEDFTEKTINATKATGDFFTKTIKETNKAIEVADKRAKADILARKLMIDGAKLESEIAGLRLKSRQEDQFSADERRKALLDAQDLQDQLLKQEQEVLQLRADSIALENTFSKSTKENKDAEAAAVAEVLRVEARRLDQQRSTQRELNRINKEIEADKKSSVNEALKLEKELTAKTLALAEFKRSKEQESRLESLEGTKEYYATKRSIEQENFNKELENLNANARAIMSNQDITEAERLTAITENNLAKEELQAEHNENMSALDQARADDQVRIRAEQEAVLTDIVQRGQNAIENIVTIAQNSIERRYQKRVKEVNSQVESGLITEEQAAAQLGAIEKKKQLDLFEIEKKAFLVRKALNLATAGVDIARGITAALALGPVGIPLASIIGGLGAIQVAAILSEPPPQAPTFADGGEVFGAVINGRSHANGGEDIHVGGKLVGNMQGGEGIFVTKREATNPALQLLDEANTANGGRSMFGSSTRFAEDGGEITQGADDERTRAMIKEIVSSMPAPVVQVQSIVGGINAESAAVEVGVI